MALIKCKECGQDISSKASSCPGCGVGFPKKTSVTTWLVLIFIVSVVYISIQTPVIPTTSTNASPPRPTASTQTSPPETWNSFNSIDDLSGDMSSYATSPRVRATREMNFPYEDVVGWLGIGCDGFDEWVYASFTESPNLTDAEVRDGYNFLSTRARFDDQLENVSLTQQWGASALHFQSDLSIIEKLASSNSFMLEIPWYGQQRTLFEYTLNGSADAISRMRATCREIKNPAAETH